MILKAKKPRFYYLTEKDSITYYNPSDILISTYHWENLISHRIVTEGFFGNKKNMILKFSEGEIEIPLESREIEQHLLKYCNCTRQKPIGIEEQEEKDI